MKVHDCARRLGISDSMVRYYDRSGLIRSDRHPGNNYRDFTDQDALAIYHAKMLRSFDMGVQEALDAQNQSLSSISGWVGSHIQELERQIIWEEMRLLRLRQMQYYFSMIQKRADSRLAESVRYDSYNVWNFGHVDALSPEEQTAIDILAQNMPFSYIAIRISLESILRPGEDLDVSIGLGILEQNREKLELELPPELQRYSGGPMISLFMETPDPFSMTKRDIAPLLEEADRRKITLNGDLIGRIFISYMKEGHFVHGMGLGISIGS